MEISNITYGTFIYFLLFYFRDKVSLSVWNLFCIPDLFCSFVLFSFLMRSHYVSLAGLIDSRQTRWIVTEKDPPVYASQIVDSKCAPLCPDHAPLFWVCPSYQCQVTSYILYFEVLGDKEQVPTVLCLVFDLLYWFQNITHLICDFNYTDTRILTITFSYLYCKHL